MTTTAHVAGDQFLTIKLIVNAATRLTLLAIAFLRSIKIQRGEQVDAGFMRNDGGRCGASSVGFNAVHRCHGIRAGADVRGLGLLGTDFGHRAFSLLCLPQGLRPERSLELLQ